MEDSFEPIPVTSELSDVICPVCYLTYPLSEIAARNLVTEQTHPLMVTRRRRGSFGLLFGERMRGVQYHRQLLALNTLEDWVFVCPLGHLIDIDIRQPQIPIALTGRPGSGKTMFLAALVREMDDLSRLAPVGVRMKLTPEGGTALRMLVHEVYDEQKWLPSTPIEGNQPFYTCPLTIHGINSRLDKAIALLFNDAPGEAFASLYDWPLC